MTASELAHKVGRAISDSTDDILGMCAAHCVATAEMRMVVASRLWEFGIEFSLLMDIRPYDGGPTSANGTGKNATD